MCDGPPVVEKDLNRFPIGHPSEDNEAFFEYARNWAFARHLRCGLRQDETGGEYRKADQKG